MLLGRGEPSGQPPLPQSVRRERKQRGEKAFLLESFQAKEQPRAAAGRVTETVTTSRQIQFGLKFLF